MEQVEFRLSRKERERLSKRADILSSAQEVIAEKGYTQATLEEIASRAEFGKGTLYNYFPGGKQEILLSIFELFYDQLCELIEKTFSPESETSFRTQLNSFFEHTFGFFLDRADLFMTLLREAHRIGFSDEPTPREFFICQKNRALSALVSPLERAINRGELRSMSPHFLAHMILVNINGLQMKSCMANASPDDLTPTTAPAMASALTTLICDGVRNGEELK